jgi:protein TonB
VSLIRARDAHTKAIIALLIAFLLHLPVLWWYGQHALRPKPELKSPPIFHLETFRSSEGSLSSAGRKNPAIPPKEVRPAPPPPLPVTPPPQRKEPSKAENKVLPAKRPDLSLGVLSQQISEVSENLVRQRNAASQGKRIVYAKEAKGHTATLSAYEEAWQAKVEHIGNLNYPKAAKEQGLSGTLTVAVAINPDGTLFSVRILNSSGDPVLDEGAIRIVRLSAPFAPLPTDLLSDIDILVITRTWRFDDQAHFSSN